MNSKKISNGVFWVSFCLIVIGIIYYKPEPLMFLPLLVSVAVMFFAGEGEPICILNRSN